MCFVVFAGWYETRTNLSWVLAVWLRRARNSPHPRVRALKLVRRWQEEHGQRMAEHGQRMAEKQLVTARCRAAFLEWGREVGLLPPALVSSSSEDSGLEGQSDAAAIEVASLSEDDALAAEERFAAWRVRVSVVVLRLEAHSNGSQKD